MTNEKQVKIDPQVFANLAIESALRTPPRPAFPTTPEPARVYGYVTFIDPASGTKFIPHQDNPAVADGYPTGVRLRFVNPTGETLDLDVGQNAAGFRSILSDGAGGWSHFHVANAGVAFYYDIQMNPDQTEAAPREGAPFAATDRSPNRTTVVSYSPDQWRFLEVSIPGYAWAAPRGAETPPFAAQPPFPDLPDTT